MTKFTKIILTDKNWSQIFDAIRWCLANMNDCNWMTINLTDAGVAESSDPIETYPEIWRDYLNNIFPYMEDKPIDVKSGNVQFIMPEAKGVQFKLMFF